MEAITLPIELPDRWIAERSEIYGTVITAVGSDGRHEGCVTVSEEVRNFSLGMTVPRRLQPGAEPSGRGWKKQLYQAAVAKLAETIR